MRKAMNADCLLLILGPGQKNKAVYPGKIFEYLRLGKPVLGLSPKGGLVEQLIREHNIGLNSDFEDIKAIKRNLVDLYTKWNAGKLTVDSNVDKIKVFERCNLTKKLAEVLYEACSVEK